MSAAYTLSAQAEQDIDAIAEYLARQGGVELALRFYDAVRASLARLGQAPGKGRPRETNDPELAGLRSWGIDGFPSLLTLYLPQAGGVRVLRVMHGARDVEGELRRESGVG